MGHIQSFLEGLQWVHGPLHKPNSLLIWARHKISATQVFNGGSDFAVFSCLLQPVVSAHSD